jgi:hypothetical protein
MTSGCPQGTGGAARGSREHVRSAGLAARAPQLERLLKNRPRSPRVVSPRTVVRPPAQLTASPTTTAPTSTRLRLERLQPPVRCDEAATRQPATSRRPSRRRSTTPVRAARRATGRTPRATTARPRCQTAGAGSRALAPPSSSLFSQERPYRVGPWDGAEFRQVRCSLGVAGEARKMLRHR